MAKKYTDHLCKCYADAIVFFDGNIEVLEKNIAHKERAGGDAADLKKAKERIQYAREGVSRMLSDRVQSMHGGAADPNKVLERLGRIKAEAEGEWAESIDMAIALIVRQREKLTNTDRGRRALQKLLGAERKRLGMAQKALDKIYRNNTDLRKAMAPLISEREKMMIAHAEHHCRQDDCEGCPFYGYCYAQNVDAEGLEKRRETMRENLKNMK